MIRVNLAVLLAKKKMKIAELHRITDIRYNTLTDYYHEMALGIRFEHIEKICEALGCTSGELVEFIPKKKKKNSPTN